MLINVTIINENFYDKTISVEVDSSYTVNNVKEKIQAQDGFKLECQEIFMRKFEEEYRSKLMRLSSVENLSSYEIDSTTNLLLFAQTVGRPMMLKVITLTGAILEVPVVSSNTVIELKRKVEELQGIPTDQQRLIYGGKQLEDERTLSFYSIPDDASVHLVLRLRGGAEGFICINVCDSEQVYVRHLKNASIRYVKEELAINEGIPADKQMIYFDGKPLDDCCLLKDIEFRGTPRLDLVVPGRIKLTVKVADKSYIMFVQVYDTTVKVREKLRRLGVDIQKSQKIYIDDGSIVQPTAFWKFSAFFVSQLDTSLQDDETLLNNNVRSGSILRVVV